MLNLRTRKIVRDIRENKMRTFLVVLTISISVFSMGSLGRVWIILSRNLSDDYLSANPSSATITTATLFDDGLVRRISRMPEVGTVEGRNGAWGRIQVGPNRWQALQLIVRSDYTHLTLDKITPETGEWPPQDDHILVERSSLALLKSKVGDTVTVEFANKDDQDLELAGTVHDITQISSSFSLIVYGYVTPQTFEDLTGRRKYTYLDIKVAEDPLNQPHIEDVVEKVTQVMETNHQIITQKDIPTPGKHPLDNIMQSVLFLLASLSALGLFLGIFLVVNIISAQLTQQTQQIGTIKAVGGVSGQIIVMYLQAVILFGLLALVVTIPLATLFSRESSVIFARLINFDVTNFAVPLQNSLLEIFGGIVVPCLAALYPILKAAHLTVRESIGFSSGQNVQFGASGFEKLLSRIPELPSTIMYPFRNIFRRKVRLALAAITLSVAGAIWIAVANLQNSFQITVNSISHYWQEDVNVSLRGMQRFDQIKPLVMQINGVEHVEPRLTTNGFRLHDDRTESAQIVDIFGLDPTSQFIQPQILQGRWLLSTDDNAMVVNIDLLKYEPDVRVGDDITFRIGREKATWHVVGIASSQVIGGSELLNSPIGYTTYNYLAKTMHASGRVNRVLIATRQKNTDSVVTGLETTFRDRGIGVASILPQTDVRDALDDSFQILLSVLQISSLIFGFVGGLGLTSMMTLNVLERTREIGIIRSVGGVRTQLAQIIVIEGIFVGLLSWFFATALAYPLSIALGNALGETLLSTPLIHTFPISGPLNWLGIVTVLSIISSLLPGRNAAQLTVRETISFE